MRRTIMAAMVLAIAGLFTASAYADGPRLKTSKQVDQFWRAQADQAGGGG